MNKSTKAKNIAGICFIALMVITGLIAGTSSDEPSTKKQTTQQNNW